MKKTKKYSWQHAEVHSTTAITVQNYCENSRDICNFRGISTLLFYLQCDTSQNPGWETPH
jgi:hypothetical protein